MNKRVDLAALIKAKRIAGRKVIEIAPPKPSRKAERDYKRALRTLIVEAARYTKTVIVPTTDLRPTTDTALDGLKTVIVRIVPDVAAVVTKLLAREEVRHRTDWVREVKRSTGIDLAGQLARDDIEDELAAMVRKNVALIQNLGDDIKVRVERAVLDAIIAGTRPTDLAAKLRDEFGILDRRAQTIARDQTAKATSSLNELRQEQAGITQYRWSGVLDNRERETHRRQEGKIFAWAVPPEGTGHPGSEVNCRCVGIAHIDLGKRE
jgi:SPP1 gp7 family putative phage head morphogenesis protein